MGERSGPWDLVLAEYAPLLDSMREIPDADVIPPFFEVGIVSNLIRSARECLAASKALIEVSMPTIVWDFVAFAVPVTALGAVSGDGFLLTASEERDLRAWRLPSLAIVYAESHLSIKFGEAGLSIAVTPQGTPAQHFALAGTDGSVKIFGPK
jgi:hypothetical protein